MKHVPWTSARWRYIIRPFALALSALLLLVLSPTRGTWAAHPLALPASDYPAGCAITAFPATNSVADRYLKPAHRSTFERLRRIDGLGWMQFATCSFVTGRGAASETHATLFGYGMNVFSSAKRAAHAIADVKLVTSPGRVGHLAARRFDRTTARESLHFLFFAAGPVEVEMYYEYSGTAPARTAARLAHAFARQGSHLARDARSLRDALRSAPSPTATLVPTDTPTPTVTATATPAATATSSPTATATSVPTATVTPRPTATATSTPAPTATPTPVVLAVQASMAQQFYPRGGSAVVNMTATINGKPAQGVRLTADFQYPAGTEACATVSDSNGQGSCSTLVPDEPDGTQVTVYVRAYGPDVSEASTYTSFVVRGP